MNTINNKHDLVVYDLFCGLGGWTRAIKKLNPNATIKGVDNNPKLNGYYPEHLDCNNIIDVGFDPCDLLVASPPCQDYSNRGRKYDRKRADIGLEVLRAIDESQPTAIALENVRGYLKSKVFEAIVKHLKKSGYQVRYGVIDAANYNTPQNRLRLILTASKVGLNKLKPSKDTLGWFDAIALTRLLKSDFPQWLQNRIYTEFSKEDLKQMWLVEKAGALNLRNLTRRLPDQPSFTITTPGNQKAIFKDGELFTLTPRQLALLQGFDRDVALPPGIGLASLLVGNAIPPPMAIAVLQSLGF